MKVYLFATLRGFLGEMNQLRLQEIISEPC